MKCPHCGKEITELLQEELRKLRSQAGKTRTAKKKAAAQNNVAKINAAYTAEKRAAAAQKRLETLRKKKELEG